MTKTGALKEYLWEKIESAYLVIFNLKSIKHLSGEVLGASQVALVVKIPLANAGDTRDMGSIPGSGRSPGVGNGIPLQYSCLENSIDRGVWWAIVHGVAKSQIGLSN